MITAAIVAALYLAFGVALYLKNERSGFRPAGRLQPLMIVIWPFIVWDLF